ncbi:MAG: hypothetical protein A3E78_16665 [Alphaproteobacteria bacterium RIFCSPHIGHO2_12_FULL_63_12]|nr:MAG: hypothetical protein A3E78_16665 [Alphaproteobacteria bacterium RIFCSPHIGHO2_12_FULL_63_12]
MAVDPTVADERPSEDLDALLASIQEQYPPLASQKLSIRRGLKDRSGRLLEFYPEWESWNPNPGTHTIEVREPGLRGRVLEESVAGDALHLLGAVDPRTGQPVDPVWRTMKDAFAASMSPRNMEREQIAYQTRQKRGEETRPFQDYFENSRLDAYIRAGIFPMVNPDWQKPGVFTLEQKTLLERMREYLMTGRAPLQGQNEIGRGLDRQTEAVGAANGLPYGQARAAVVSPPDLAAGANATLSGLEGPSIVPQGSRMLPRVRSDAPTNIFTQGDVDFAAAPPSIARPYEVETPREGEVAEYDRAQSSIVPRSRF